MLSIYEQYLIENFWIWQNKQFIYRGLEYERIGAFTQRLQIEFPQAQILTKNSPPESSILVEKGQYIQISNVRPIPDIGSLFKDTIFPVPEKIAKFYHVNDVKRFQNDRPIYKGQADKDKDNEVSRLWIERTILDISDPLPNILRWFEITDRYLQDFPLIRSYTYILSTQCHFIFAFLWFTL